MTAPLDLAALERLARAATPGPWRSYRCRSVDDDDLACGIKDEPFVSESEDAYQRGVVVDTSYDECHHHMNRADADWIAAANPTAILELIERCRRAEAVVDAVRWYRTDGSDSILRHAMNRYDGVDVNDD